MHATGILRRADLYFVPVDTNFISICGCLPLETQCRRGNKTKILKQRFPFRQTSSENNGKKTQNKSHEKHKPIVQSNCTIQSQNSGVGGVLVILCRSRILILVRIPFVAFGQLEAHFQPLVLQLCTIQILHGRGCFVIRPVLDKAEPFSA